MGKEAHLIVKNACKTFPGVKALDNVSMEAYAGEALALIGVNGAGKSTLMNALAGEFPLDSGEITIRGKVTAIASQRDAKRSAIALIHQESVVFPTMTVAENIFINDIERFRERGFIRYKKLNREAQRYLDMLGCTVNPGELVSRITIGERQMTEMARALAQGADILLFDEPTSSLTVNEKGKLFEIIRNLKKQGKVILYITHFIDEVVEICERAVVLRDGKVTGKCMVDSTNVDDFITMMLGSAVQRIVNEKQQPREASDEVLRVEHLRYLPRVQDVSFGVRRGEVYGIWGLLGSGRSESIRSILGLEKKDAGSIRYCPEKGARPVEIRGKELMRYSGYVTENRHFDGLFLQQPIWKNITIPNLPKFTKVFLNESEEHAYSEELIQRLEIKTVDDNVLVSKLSGGNQQKVVMARWIGVKPALFFLDEPTRGVDVGAKSAIHRIILELAEQGNTIIMISSEIEEIINLCDRVLVIRDGESIAEVERENITKINLMRLCIGEEVV